ncbi:MAG TPA: type II toxin-antitoxin system VapC family toxin [Acidimicrobiales bacterium]|jgi:predicted nucleic acid-binding protein|nr:type II toxin-antitoxin system VapC family toxin [Acidimicrobiales bacterium]
MLVVDASVLFEVVADTPDSEQLRDRLAADTDHSAPHLVDAEVLSVVQTAHRRGHLDDTAAGQAIEDLRAWPGERWSHRPLLQRAWELRENVRGYDALYVALAEALGATLLTRDRRLALSQRATCRIEMV